MATSDYLSFIEQPIRQARVLVEIRPKQLLEDWTSEGDSIYSIDWPHMVQEDVVAGGLYRRIHSVQQDGVEMTRATTQSDLDTGGTYGRWFYEEPIIEDVFDVGDPLGLPLGSSGGLLQVHLAGDEDPDDQVAIVVYFTIFLGTSGVHFDHVYYEPRLTGKALPHIAAASEDIFFGVTKTVASGSISVSNADGLFDVLAADWSWKNARATIYFGGDNLDHTPGGGGDYVNLAEMLIEDFIPALEEGTLTVRDLHKVTLRQLPPNLFSLDDYPDMDPSFVGKPIPLMIGDWTDFGAAGVDGVGGEGAAISPIRIGGTGQAGDTNTYLVADPSLQDIKQVGLVYNSVSNTGVVLIGDAATHADLQWISPNCTFSILASYTDTYGEITCRCKGDIGNGEAWETYASSVLYIRNYGEITGRIYNKWLGVPAADIDATAARLADAIEPAEQRFYLTSQISARRLISDLERGVLGRTIRQSDGTIAPTIWSPGIDSSSARSIGDSDITDFLARPRIETVFSRVIVQYGENPRLNTRVLYETNSLRTRYLHLDDREEELGTVTLLKDEANAIQLANRLLFMSRGPDVNVRVVENGIRFMDSQIGDRLYVTLSRAPSPSGEYVNEIFEIVEITKVLAPEPHTEMIINNLRGVGPYVGIWTDNSAPPWKDATSSDKSTSGYWTAFAGRADPGDAASEGVSIWW
jgi:hypothetical protein